LAFLFSRFCLLCLIVISLRLWSWQTPCLSLLLRMALILIALYKWFCSLNWYFALLTALIVARSLRPSLERFFALPDSSNSLMLLLQLPKYILQLLSRFCSANKDSNAIKRVLPCLACLNSATSSKSNGKC
jgi:hypothetical protein